MSDGWLWVLVGGAIQILALWNYMHARELRRLHHGHAVLWHAVHMIDPAIFDKLIAAGVLAQGSGLR